jgi:hypothetical protein
MSDKPVDYGREVRDTIVKSSLTGVAATALAVTIFSPAGFGGLIGTSLASNFGLEPSAEAADDPYARLPAFPAPLSQAELDTIRGQLARTTASLEITRAATEERIDHIRSIALTDRATVTFAPAPRAVEAQLRLDTSEAVEDEAPVESFIATPVSYEPQAMVVDRDLALAELIITYTR